MVSDKYYPYMVFPEHQHIYQYMNNFLKGKAEYNEDLIKAALHQAPKLAVSFLEKHHTCGNLRKIAMNSICSDTNVANIFWYNNLYINEDERHRVFKVCVKTERAALSIIKHNAFNPLDDWEKELLIDKIVEWKHEEYASLMLSQQDFWRLSDEKRNKLAPLGVAYKLINVK